MVTDPASRDDQSAGHDHPKPTVVIATRLFAPEPAAASSRLLALATALDQRGANVEVLTSRPPTGSDRSWRTPPGITVRRWPVVRDRRGQVRGYVPYASFDVPLSLRLGFSRRPSVVVVEPPPTTGAVVRLVQLARRGVPYVYYAADVLSVAATGVGTPPRMVALLRNLEARVVRDAALVLSVSPQMTDEVLRLGAHRSRIVELGHGVDTSVFTRSPHDSTEPLAVYAGTMSELHGASVFIDAFERVRSRHPGARLRFLGRGSERDRISATARRLGGRVDVMDPVPPATLAELLQRTRVGLASYRPDRHYTIAHPTKMYPVLASGTPILFAGESPGAEEIRAHRLGWAVPWDVSAVAAALDDALSADPDPVERTRLASWTKEHHSIQRIAAVAADRVLDIATGSTS